MAAFPDELFGERIRLCRKTLDAIDDVIVAIAISFEALHTWMAWAKTMPTRDSLVALTGDDDTQIESDQQWSYWIREIDKGQVVGSAALNRRGGDDELEIGYWVRSDRTGRGYATEAASILTSAAFDSALGIATVKISMDRANTASAAVPQKLGFTLDDEFERDVESPGHSGRGLAWAVVRRDWPTPTS